MGNSILINEDAWIDDMPQFRLRSLITSMHNTFVHNLINNDQQVWKKEIIVNTYDQESADLNLQILLVRVRYANQLVWGGDA